MCKLAQVTWGTNQNV